MAQTFDGSLKVRAKRWGFSFERVQAHWEAGEKFCPSRRHWAPFEAFGVDPSRGDGRAVICAECRKEQYRLRRAGKQKARGKGPAPDAPREGDARQARRRINVLVRDGRLAHPNEVPCFDCGHRWEPGSLRHEYDHYRGYSAAYHYDVQAVCTKCHHRRHPQKVS